MTDIFFHHRRNTDLMYIFMNHSRTNTSTTLKSTRGQPEDREHILPEAWMYTQKQSLGVVLLMFAR